MFSYILLIYVHLHMYELVCTCHNTCAEVRGQLLSGSSLSPPGRSLGHQVWHQVSHLTCLPAEPLNQFCFA